MTMEARGDSGHRLAPALVTIGLGVILFFAVNTIAATAFGSLKADLTEDGLFTVTESTRDILAAIDQPITLHLYQSAPLIASAPSLRIYSDRVRETLRTYAEIAGDTLRIEFIDPQPFSTEEDRAISYGLRGIQLNSTGERGYFGLVGTNSVDGLETIAFLNPTREQFLEYDLTRIVNRLAAASEPKIAVIDGLGIFGDASARRRPSAVLETINSNYDVEQLAQNVSEIPDGIDALLVVHPAIVTDSAQYAIDQYVLRGGPALIFLDPLAENAPANPRNPREPEFPSSNLDRLMRAWGAEMAPAQVVGDRALALRVTATAGPTRQFLEYLPWLQLRRQSLQPRRYRDQRAGADACFQCRRFAPARRVGDHAHAAHRHHAQFHALSRSGDPRQAGARQAPGGIHAVGRGEGDCGTPRGAGDHRLSRRSSSAGGWGRGGCRAARASEPLRCARKPDRRR